MYILAVADGRSMMAERIVRCLITKGVASVTKLDGVDMAKAHAHKPERQVGSGPDWVLWQEPPFGVALDPPRELVLAWVEDIASGETRASTDA